MGKKISIVIPVFNEENSLEELFYRINNVFQTPEKNFEIVFIDDGSTDNSLNVLKKIFDENRERVKIIEFRKNFGKAAALSAGFREAEGDYIITMDGDLQDQPEEIPKFIEKLEEGFDVVSGWKYPRKDPITKTLPSKIFNFVTSLISGIKLHDFNCGFKGYKREAIKNLKLYGELHRYIPVVLNSQGFKITEIKVKHEPRKYGKSKYGLKRFFSGFFDLFTVLMLTKFRSSPLHIFGIFGALLTISGGIITLYLIVERLLGRYLSNRPLFYFSLSITIVGLQIFFFGLLAEMIANIKSEEGYYSIKKIYKSNE